MNKFSLSRVTINNATINTAEVICQALKKAAFEPINTDIDFSSAGIVDYDNYTHEFDPIKATIDGSIFFAIRVDVQAAPASVVRAMLPDALAEFSQETGKEKLSRADRIFVKEQLTRKLARQQYPKTTVIKAIWDIERGNLFVGATSERQRDMFMQVVRDALVAECTDENLGISSSRVSFRPGGELTASDYFMNLVVATDGDSFIDGEPYSLGRTVTMTSATDKIAMQSDGILLSGEFIAAVKEGKQIKKIQLCLDGNADCGKGAAWFTMDNTGTVSGIKMPKWKIDEENPDGEKIHVLGHLTDIAKIIQHGENFIENTPPEQTEQIKEELQAWVDGL